MRTINGIDYLDSEDLAEMWKLSKRRLMTLRWESNKYSTESGLRMPPPDLRISSNAPLYKLSRINELQEWRIRWNNRSITASGRKRKRWSR